MTLNHVTLDYSVRCDLCGHPIKAGSTCKMRTDAVTRKLYFEHIVCPNAVAVVIHTVPPTLLNALVERTRPRNHIHECVLATV